MADQPTSEPRPFTTVEIDPAYRPPRNGRMYVGTLAIDVLLYVKDGSKLGGEVVSPDAFAAFEMSSVSGYRAALQEALDEAGHEVTVAWPRVVRLTRVEGAEVEPDYERVREADRG